MSEYQSDRFTFGGHDLTDDVWVNPTRSVGLASEDVTVTVPGRPGERFVRQELRPLTIPCHIRLRGSDPDHEAVAKLRRKLTAILVTEDVQPLVLPDEPTLYYLAKLTTPGELDKLWHTGSADLEFTAYDPIAYGQEGDELLGNGTTMVFTEGTWETRPVIRLEADGGQVSVANQLDQKLTIDAECEQGQAIVIDMEARTTTVDGEYAPIVLSTDSYFPLQPGRNDITVTGAHGAVYWQERWA